MTSSSSDRPGSACVRPGEFELIARLFAPLSAGEPGAFGLRDDVASLPPRPGNDVVLKTDAIVEGVHFLPDDPADLVARKALRVNLSDLAAKGAAPAGYLLSLSIPASCSMAWLEAFARGLAEDQQRYSISLLGGDTTATPGPISIAVTLLGYLPSGTTVRRAGARAGDAVFVTGTIGDASAGLAILKNDIATNDVQARQFLVGRYRLPEPRVGLASGIRSSASASIDVSDGLLADLAHIAEVSGVGIEVLAARIPLSPAFREVMPSGQASVVRAVCSGDDYEIAFSAPPGARAAIAALAVQSGVPITEIGRVVRGQGICLLNDGGKAVALDLDRLGFTHF